MAERSILLRQYCATLRRHCAKHCQSTQKIRSYPRLGLKIMNYINVEKNYKGHLSKTQPQARFETAPGLENHEVLNCQQTN